MTHRDDRLQHKPAQLIIQPGKHTRKEPYETRARWFIVDITQDSAVTTYTHWFFNISILKLNYPIFLLMLWRILKLNLKGSDATWAKTSRAISTITTIPISISYSLTAHQWYVYTTFLTPAWGCLDLSGTIFSKQRWDGESVTYS